MVNIAEIETMPAGQAQPEEASPHAYARAINRHVGRRIKERIEKLGLQKTEVADRIHCSYSALLKHIAGTLPIRLGTLHEYAHILDTPVGYFFEGDDFPAAPHNLPTNSHEKPILLAANESLYTDLNQFIESEPDKVLVEGSLSALKKLIRILAAGEVVRNENTAIISPLQKASNKKANAEALEKLVGRNVRRIRKERGWEQSILANHVGVTYQQFGKRESGKNRFGAGDLFKIACFTNTPIDEFFEPVRESSFKKKRELEFARSLSGITNARHLKALGVLVKALCPG